MTPQPVVIHGVRCTLQSIAGGGMSKYAVLSPAGTTLAQQSSRFAAIAAAAAALRQPGARQ